MVRRSVTFRAIFGRVGLFWGDFRIRSLSYGTRNRAGWGFLMVGFPATKWSEQTKASFPGSKNLSHPLIFYLQISNLYGSPLGERCQIRSPSTWPHLTHKSRYLLSLLLLPKQQRSCLPISKRNDNYKLILISDYCGITFSQNYDKTILWVRLFTIRKIKPETSLLVAKRFRPTKAN